MTKSVSFRKTCRICKGKNLEKTLDLGAMPPANAFLPKSDLGKSEERFPLELYFCNECSLLQLRHVVDPVTLFKNYHYQTSASGPLVAHFKEMSEDIVSKYIRNKNDLVIEIGSNDGSLLENIKTRAKILGVDPAPGMAKIAKTKGVPTLTDFFNKTTAKKIIKTHGNAKIIVANNVIAHIDDIHSVFAGIKTLLNENGKFIFEAHWVGNLIGKGGFDQIYHEHLCYFSLHAISHLTHQFGLRILDITLVTIHGESIRVTIGKTGAPHKAVKLFMKKEKKLGLHLLKTFKQFAEKVEQNKRSLVSLLGKLKTENKKIIGYGAPAKGNTLLNFCHIGPSTLDFITDTTLLKQGLFTPGSRIPIFPPEKIVPAATDYILLLSWNYASEILKKESDLRERGVKFIIPVPKVKIV
ncbi:MAG: class I SAM-dependent methyltransferase [bacterium]|nr:class I SAM-dependent methyltransferase [bacterium]